MTYLEFLILFLAGPLFVLALLTWRDRSRGISLPSSLQGAPAAWTILAHVFIAVLYTTPWDNYLVATRVWWYDPQLVTGITLGWVPIEEYCFFVLQTIATGLWLLFLARHLSEPAAFLPRLRVRLLSTLALVLVWISAAAILIVGWRPGTYLALILVWALPPIMVQLAFGADILWHRRRLVALALIPAVLYLSVADSLAIGSGTWTIDPEQSLNWLLGGVLPFEEFLFFLVTNTLIVFGVTLVQSRESHNRALAWRARIRQALNEPKERQARSAEVPGTQLSGSEDGRPPLRANPSPTEVAVARASHSTAE